MCANCSRITAASRSARCCAITIKQAKAVHSLHLHRSYRPWVPSRWVLCGRSNWNLMISVRGWSSSNQYNIYNSIISHFNVIHLCVLVFLLQSHAGSASVAHHGGLLGPAGRQIRRHPEGERAKENATNAGQPVEFCRRQHEYRPDGYQCVSAHHTESTAATEPDSSRRCHIAVVAIFAAITGSRVAASITTRFVWEFIAWFVRNFTHTFFSWVSFLLFIVVAHRTECPTGIGRCCRPHPANEYTEFGRIGRDYTTFNYRRCPTAQRSAIECRCIDL